MSGDEHSSSYAPKSPDLSSFYSSSPTQHASRLLPPNPGSGSGQYKPYPPAYSYSSSYAPPMPADAVQQQQQQQKIKPEFPLHQPLHQISTADHGPSVSAGQNFYSPSHAQPYQSQVFPKQVRRQSPTYFQPTDFSESPSTQSHSEMPPRRDAAATTSTPVIEPSPVKTKFPTARIKRIMQADEEVGKVAQQTPIAVGKALELFMTQLVSKSAEVAKDKGSKRVTAPMLKQVVETDDQWDFLREIVSRVEHEKEGSKAKVKAESESDEDSEPRRRGRGGRKRKM